MKTWHDRLIAPQLLQPSEAFFPQIAWICASLKRQPWQPLATLWNRAPRLNGIIYFDHIYFDHIYFDHIYFDHIYFDHIYFDQRCDAALPLTIVFPSALWMALHTKQIDD